MNVYRHGNVLDVCTFRPRFVLRRRSSRLEVQDECPADPYCPDFIASWHSQLGLLAMHPTRIAQNAAGIMRPAAEIAPCLERQPVHAISVNLKRPDRRLRRADKVWPRATSGRQGANDMRHHQLHAVEPHRGNNLGPLALAAYSSERKDPDRSNSRSPPVQPQMCIRRSSIDCNELRTSPIGWGVGS
jgi:DNA-binding transcriptional regulator YdaS (Cro superfamily)